MAFCGLSSVAAAGRMLFAFSRDDGLPGAGWLKRVSRRYRTPANALTAIVVVSWLFTVAAFVVGTGTAIVIITAISTIFLYAAYGVCIYLGATTKEWLEHRVWSLGRWSKPVAWISVFWVIVLMILFSFPTSGNICWPFMLAGVVLLLVYYFGYAKARFQGPKRAGRGGRAHRDRARVRAGRPRDRRQLTPSRSTRRPPAEPSTAVPVPASQRVR